jgi:hypothetical protein
MTTIDSFKLIESSWSSKAQKPMLDLEQVGTYGVWYGRQKLLGEQALQYEKVSDFWQQMALVQFIWRRAEARY